MMISFIKAVLKWLVALFVASGIFVFLCLLALGGLSQAFQPQPVEVRDGSVLVLDLGLNLVDSPRSIDPLQQMLGELEGRGHQDVPLRRALTAIDRASRDEAIVGILLKGHFSGRGFGNSPAVLREFRAKLDAFQATGKKLWAYVDNDGLGDYFVKSVAGDLWMNPYSLLEVKGLGAEIIYWGTAFDRLGIDLQVERAGRYKTAAESFVDSSMSPENREQLSRLLETVWAEMAGEIAEARGVGFEQLDNLASEKALMMSGEVAAAGLVDALVPEDELIARILGESAVAGAENTFEQIDFARYLKLDRRPGWRAESSGVPGVAVVYVEGTIVDGEGGLDNAGGDRIARILREVRQDEAVKAVVLRVNSPGGSVTASEKILREVELLQQVKPVIVSMGGYAASGGYWIATLADRIVAEPTTVTGSIGVFSALPNIERLTENLGLQVERVQTNDLSTMFSIFHPKTETAMARMRHFVEVSYESFLERIVRGRGLSPEAADAVAQGRVWSGAGAVEVGLVDSLGGLQDAVAQAGELAGLARGFPVTDHPREQSWEELISDFFNGNATLPKLDLSVSALTANPHLETLEAEIRWLRQMNDPRHLYAYSPLRLQW